VLMPPIGGDAFARARRSARGKMGRNVTS
jgi:hypothetical protein